jgi:hypothetical protein
VILETQCFTAQIVTPCLSCPLRRRRRGRKGRYFATCSSGFLGLSAEILEERVQIIIEACKEFLASFAHLRDDRIFVIIAIVGIAACLIHGDTINSSGVTIRGAAKPASAQALTILWVKIALAKCRQFHVSRNDIPCAAANAICAASALALVGRLRSLANRSASSAAMGDGGSIVIPSSAFNRSAAADASPAAASDLTISDVNNSKCFRLSHHFRVRISCDKRTISRLGQAVR